MWTEGWDGSLGGMKYRAPYPAKDAQDAKSWEYERQAFCNSKRQVTVLRGSISKPIF